MRPDVSHIGLAVDTGDGGSCRRPPNGRTCLVRVILLYIVSLVTFLQHCVISYLALFRAILYVNDSYWTEALYSLNHLLSCLLESFDFKTCNHIQVVGSAYEMKL